MSSHCTMMAHGVARLGAAQREFFFAWKNLQAQGLRDRAHYKKARDAFERLSAAHALIERTIASGFNDKVLLEIVEKRHYREVQSFSCTTLSETMRKKTGYQYPLAISSEGLLAVGDEAGNVHLWRRRTDGVGFVFEQIIDGPALCEATAIAFRRDGNIVLGSMNGTVHVLDARNGWKSIWNVPGETHSPILKIIVDVAGRLIVVVQSGMVRTWPSDGSVYENECSRIWLGRNVSDVQLSATGSILQVARDSGMGESYVEAEYVAPFSDPRMIGVRRFSGLLLEEHLMGLAPGNNDGEFYIAREGTLGQVDRVQVLEDGRYGVEHLFGYVSNIHDIQVLPNESILLATMAGVWVMKKRTDVHLEPDSIHFYDKYDADLEFDIGDDVHMARALADGTIVATGANGSVHVFDGDPIV